MNKLTLAATAAACAAVLAACGGGSDNTSTGTMRLSLTDAPACGYDSVFVTVEKVRVHKSSSASDSDSGWSEVALASPQRVDLLTLTNGTLLPLGQTQLPAGTYTQMRLVLAENSAAEPMANSIIPTGGAETALTTPSGQQSGLKMNVNLEVPVGKVADFAIDFDACKSFVRAGNSGQYLLKPVLSVIPILTLAGQRIEGWVDPALVTSGATISAQSAGKPVRATPPDATTGKFTLYPVPAGNYELVITAAGRVNAVMTGVPVIDSAATVIGSQSARLLTPAAGAAAGTAAGVITLNGSAANTGGSVRATQTLASGPTVEVGYAAADAASGAYSLSLPTDAAAFTAYVAAATTFSFATDPSTTGKYKLEASATGIATPKASDITLTPAGVTADFVFP